MRALTGEALLAAWEAAAQLPELLRPLALLAAADPAGSAFLSALPLAKRDLNLVRLHTMSFSPDLAVFGTCPDCGERLEFALPADEVAASLSAPADARPVEWIEDGRAFRLRPVTTDDLVAVAGVPDPDAALKRRAGTPGVMCDRAMKSRAWRVRTPRYSARRRLSVLRN